MSKDGSDPNWCDDIMWGRRGEDKGGDHDVDDWGDKGDVGEMEGDMRERGGSDNKDGRSIMRAVKQWKKKCTLKKNGMGPWGCCLDDIGYRWCPCGIRNPDALAFKQKCDMTCEDPYPGYEW